MTFFVLVFAIAAWIASELWITNPRIRFPFDVLIGIAAFVYFLWKIHWTISFLW